MLTKVTEEEWKALTDSLGQAPFASRFSASALCSLSESHELMSSTRQKPTNFEANSGHHSDECVLMSRP